MKLFSFWKKPGGLGAASGAIFGFMYFIIACFPGFMSVDSLEQYKQAHTLQFSDGHPPVMAWLWSKLDLIWDGPQNLLFLQLMVLWVGLYIWRKNAGGSRFAYLFILVGFFPWVANFEGVLWKDVGMAFCLLLALAILSGQNITIPKILAVACLMLYAFMVRSNAPAALIPVVWYAVLRTCPGLSQRMKIAMTVLTLVLTFVFLNFFNYRILHAEKNNMATYMMVDDLVHLSLVAERSLLPGIDFETVKACSQETIGETKLVGRLFCLATKPAYMEIAPISYEAIKTQWISALKSYPLTYAKFRWNAYLYLLRNPLEPPYIFSFSGISPNEMSLVQKDNGATSLLKIYLRAMVHLIPFAFKPYFWLLLALLFFGATFRMEGDKDAITLLRVLLVSALLYMFSYIPVTPMADFRYVYWSTLAISLALVKYATSDLRLRPYLRSRTG